MPYVQRKQVKRSRKRVEARITGSSEVKAPVAPPMILIKEALDDLSYIEPARARDRVISCINELFLRIRQIEHAHQVRDHEESPQPKVRRRR